MDITVIKSRDELKEMTYYLGVHNKIIKGVALGYWWQKNKLDVELTFVEIPANISVLDVIEEVL